MGRNEKETGEELVCHYCHAVVTAFDDNPWFECPVCGHETFHGKLEKEE